MKKIDLKTENEIQREILEVLNLSPRVARAYRQSVEKRKGHPRNGFKGLSDIGGLMVNGTFFQIEVKSATGKASEEQLDWLKCVRSTGNIGFIARNVDDVIKGLKL